jgi:hypothetical protein
LTVNVFFDVFYMTIKSIFYLDSVDIIELVGYHGTNRQAAESILANGFEPSQNEYDWLGEGVYFWQDAPYRAWDWSCTYTRRKHPQDEPAVIRSIIQIQRSECMDLLDWKSENSWAELLGVVHKSLRKHQDLPKQRSGRNVKLHPLDKVIIDYVIDKILAKDGLKIVAVRAGFEEGKKIFVGSALYEKTHVQVAVRDTRMIQESTLLLAADF